jgi:hypothetical protein
VHRCFFRRLLDFACRVAEYLFLAVVGHLCGPTSYHIGDM